MEAYWTLSDYRAQVAHLDHKAVRARIASDWSNATYRAYIISMVASIPIEESGEALVPIGQEISVFDPAPYSSLGAPYGALSPYVIRRSLAEKLKKVDAALQSQKLRLKIFDVYRPLAVQAFMFNHAIAQLLVENQDPTVRYTQQYLEACKTRASSVWSLPNTDAKCPPPHSTGAAIDLTLADCSAQVLPMGAPIDHNGPESYPDFLFSSDADADSDEKPDYTANRNILIDAMAAEGFMVCPFEYWHFSFGDQWWAFLQYMYGHIGSPKAIYGRADLVMPAQQPVDSLAV